MNQNQDTLGWTFAEPGRLLQPGETLYANGLSTQEGILDALYHATGTVAHCVWVWQNNQTLLWRVDARDLLPEFARRCAADVVHLWDAPPCVHGFLSTGEGANAARAAATAAIRAARAAHVATYAVDATYNAAAATNAAAYAADPTHAAANASRAARTAASAAHAAAARAATYNAAAATYNAARAAHAAAARAATYNAAAATYNAAAATYNTAHTAAHAAAHAATTKKYADMLISMLVEEANRSPTSP